MNRNPQNRPDTTLRDVCLAVLRHRKKATVFFLLTMTATVVITLLTPKTYVSESKLFVRLGRENAMLDPAATLGNDPVVALASSRESEINSVADMLANRAILEGVVDELGPESILNGLADASSTESTIPRGFVQWLEETGGQARQWASEVTDSLRSMLSSSQLSARDQATEELKENLVVEPVRKSNVVCITYEAKQPELAQRVVVSLVNAYLESTSQATPTGSQSPDARPHLG